MERFIPKKEEKSVISLRLKDAMLEQIDEKSAAHAISRNEFLTQCIAFALDHMEDNKKQK